MSAASSILGQCPECCECLAPVILATYRSISANIYGYIRGDAADRKYFSGVSYSSNVVHSGQTSSAGGTESRIRWYESPLPPNATSRSSLSITTGILIDPDFYGTCGSGPYNYSLAPNEWGGSIFSTFDNRLTYFYASARDDSCGLGSDNQNTAATCVSSVGETVCREGETENILTVTFTGEYTMLDADVVSEVEVALATKTYPDFAATLGAGAVRNSTAVSADFYSVRYKFRFKIPLISGGTCYRVSWVERFIPEAGVGLTSVSTVTRGVYRPAITIAAPPAGGRQARAVAIMAANGTLSGIGIVDPGFGYLSPPAVTVQAAINGGTSATGWTAALTGSQVTTISGGTAGNFLPTIAVTGGGGIGATLAVVLDQQGGIFSVTTTASGSGYAAAPALTITPKCGGTTAATLHVHIGTETAKCEAWDGVAPVGYNPSDSTTYPTLPLGSPGYYEVPVPSAEGVTTIANVLAHCDCSNCPA